MADDNTLRSYRPSEGYQREAAPSDASGRDPLSELARVIGQFDPLAEFGRDKRAQGHHESPSLAAASPAAPDWRRSPEPADGARSPARDLYSADEPRRHDPYQMASAGDTGYQHQPRMDMPVDDGYARDRRHWDADDRDPRHDVKAAGPADRGPQQEETYFDDGAPMQPEDEAIYDDPPPKRSSKTYITAIALIGCAMVGTAGAYGYRTYYSGEGGGPAPVIVADKTPAKLMSADPASTATTKVIQDRVGGRGGGERVISREEPPVEVKAAGTTSPPRVVLAAPVPAQAMASTLPSGVPPAPPAGMAPAMPPAAAVAPAPPGAAAVPPPPAASETKRIRTVPIRPDGTDLSGRPVTGLVPAAPGAAAPRTVPAAKAPPARGAPLSLDPTTEALPPPAAPRTAVLAPPAPRAPAAETARGGGYVVQVSSQRSEAEAQASLRSLQAKYGAAVSGQPTTVRRVELGNKGVWYRALLGPFASANEANQVCSSLKAAGGQCNIQRN